MHLPEHLPRRIEKGEVLHLFPYRIGYKWPLDRLGPERGQALQRTLNLLDQADDLYDSPPEEPFEESPVEEEPLVDEFGLIIELPKETPTIEKPHGSLYEQRLKSARSKAEKITLMSAATTFSIVTTIDVLKEIKRGMPLSDMLELHKIDQRMWGEFFQIYGRNLPGRHRLMEQARVLYGEADLSPKPVVFFDFDKDDIDHLMGLGYPRDKVINALAVVNPDQHWSGRVGDAVQILGRQTRLQRILNGLIKYTHA